MAYKRIDYDDTLYRPIMFRVGAPLHVSISVGPLRTLAVFDIKTMEDVARAEEVLAVCRKMLNDAVLNPAVSIAA